MRDRVQKIIDRKYDIDFNEGDGGQAFLILSKDFAFGFTVDEQNSKLFYENVYDKIKKMKPIEIINPNAKITSITVIGDRNKNR